MHLPPLPDELMMPLAVADALSREAPLSRWFGDGLDAEVDERRLTAFAAELGWLGLTEEAELGGSGAAITDEMLVFVELGRALAPVSLTAASTAAKLAPPVVAHDLVTGAAMAGICVDRAQGRVKILGGAGASFAVEATAGTVTLWRMNRPALPEDSFDWAVSLGAVEASDLEMVARSKESATHLRLLVAAQQLGTAERATDESVAYAKVREQFGRPIGSFQAVRHRCADMAVRAAAARAQLYFAAVAVRDRRTDADFQIEAACVLAGEAATANTLANIDNHGAIGVTADNPAHMLLKRAFLWSHVTGSPADRLDRLAAKPAPEL